MDPLFIRAVGLILQAPASHDAFYTGLNGDGAAWWQYLGPGESFCVGHFCGTVRVEYFDEAMQDAEYPVSDGDLNHDGDVGTDADIEAFFTDIARDCCSGDWDGDGVAGTTEDVAAFFAAL